MKKYTILITQQCNLTCKYCYIAKKQAVMSHSIAEKVVNFIFEHASSDEKINIGFFGGEPLLEFELIKDITDLIIKHPCFNKKFVELKIVTNGTIFSNEIADFIIKHGIGLVISCDGPPIVQNALRLFKNGHNTSDIIKDNIDKAIEAFSNVPVNAVYHPITFRKLPQSIEYFSSLGIRQIYLNPDYSAPWSKEDIASLPEVYGSIAEKYINYYMQETPHFISLIDSKIAVILRGGYATGERCQMGKREFAFTPDGNIYLCERLIGEDQDKHCIGNINSGLNLGQLSCHTALDQSINTECLSCGINEYCMNWCGCSNYFSSGFYNRVNSFLCASERAAIRTSFDVFQKLEKLRSGTFMDHLGGLPIANSRQLQN